MSAKRFHVGTFGCRVNQADSASLISDLEAAGYLRAPAEEADVVLFNTCTVTHRSDADLRKAVSRARRNNPDATIVVTGCYAQRKPEEIAALPGVSAVFGRTRQHEIIGALAEIGEETVIRHDALTGGTALPEVIPATTVVERTRPFVKIQDGCDAHCTYCIVPHVRGAARSAPVESILDAIRSLIQRGFFEIVLTGVNLGDYGRALSPPTTLVDLVRKILAIPALGRLRLSCIEPMSFPLELAEIARTDTRLAPHFHLPLQSGSDTLLKRMGRPYRADDFLSILGQLREILPHACIGTDLITGFPTETEEDHETTRQLITKADIDYLHVFSYSDREGTASTRLPTKIDPRIIKARCTDLIQLGDRRWERFLDLAIGQAHRCITLERDRRDPRYITALSDSYRTIRCEDEALQPNQHVLLKVTKRSGNVLLGVRVV